MKMLEDVDLLVVSGGQSYRVDLAWTDDKSIIDKDFSGFGVEDYFGLYNHEVSDDVKKKVHEQYVEPALTELKRIVNGVKTGSVQWGAQGD